MKKVNMTNQIEVLKSRAERTVRAKVAANTSHKEAVAILVEQGWTPPNYGQVVVRSAEYFQSEDFDCTKERLLNELATRAEHWFKQTDGSYHVPKVGGQGEQIIEMAIAASLKR